LADPYPLRRERAAELSARHAFASQLLDFYGRLLGVQARAFQEVRADAPPAEEVAAFVAMRVLPQVIDVTTASGPRQLVDAAVACFVTEEASAIVRAWLEGKEQPPVEAFIARASTQPVLEALALQHPDPGPARGTESSGGATCPRCGGLPQLSYLALSGEALVSGPRYLVCARCSNAWVFSRMTCAACLEDDPSRLPIYQESAVLPHLRVDACDSCHRYLLTVELRRDPRAIPLVDELAAVPLDLYARERGMTKITPNLLGN
jgi:FdhE protein